MVLIKKRVSRGELSSGKSPLRTVEILHSLLCESRVQHVAERLALSCVLLSVKKDVKASYFNKYHS